MIQHHRNPQKYVNFAWLRGDAWIRGDRHIMMVSTNPCKIKRPAWSLLDETIPTNLVIFIVQQADVVLSAC